MKIPSMPVSAMAVVIALLLFVPAMALSQQLDSGALLTIQKSDGSLNLAVYDSQIHSGVIQTSPCDAGNLAALVTDAYVLQGGSPSGCDNGDTYETHQAPALFEFVGTGYKFDITTFYQVGGCNDTGNTGPIEPICANPDSGFLKVTNNGTTSFTGTITLSGNSPIGGPPYCAPGGLASDSFTGTLNPGDHRTFALAPDSSNCGGYNASQTQTLTAGGTAIFPIGTDDYELTPLNNLGGEHITLLPVPVLQSSSDPGSTPFNTFNPGASFSTFSCSPYGDLSEAGNLVCPEFQLTCSGATDCDSFLYTTTTHYSFPPVITGIGGPGFLKASGQSCPSTTFDKNIFLFYSQDTTHKGGGGGLSCFVAAFTPGAPPVTSATSFEGFEWPVSDTQLNFIIAGFPVPLSWDYDFPNLTVCSNALGTGCTAPWVYPASIQIACPNSQPVNGTLVPISVTKLLNFGKGEEGLTEYFLFWKTMRHSKGCVSVVFTFDTGLVVAPAQFKYIF
jgi:hypothetical protein